MLLYLALSIFPNLWQRFKIGIFEYWLRIHFQIFSNLLNSWKIGIFEVSLLLYFVSLWDRLSSRVYVIDREVGVDIQYVTILWQLKGWKHCFQA